MSRTDLDMTKDRTSILGWVALAVTMAMVRSVPAQTQGRGSYAQQMLDFLAMPAQAGGVTSIAAGFPSRFADWTEAQRTYGLQRITQRCALLNALEHDNPQARMVPEPMTKLEEVELAIGVCLPAEMPVDWPERRRYLDDAQRLIAKANSYRGALHLPKNLIPN